MNTTFNSSMFESIKDALTKEKQSTGFKDILKLEAGNSYLVRLIPNITKPEETFYHFYSHGWNSVKTGQFISAISPTTWGDPDPIAQKRFAIYKNGTAEEKAKSKLLNRRENWLAKVFVVSDPKHPENNNKVKMLRFGRQLHKVIMEGIEGEESKEFGPRVFDLTANGCNLKIKAETQGEYTTFVASKFMSPSEIPGMTPEKIQEVYNDPMDPKQVHQVKSYKELEDMLNQHYYGKVEEDDDKSTGAKKQSKVTKIEKASEPELDASSNLVDDTQIPGAEVPDQTPTPSEEVLDDSKVKELLKGLED